MKNKYSENSISNKYFEEVSKRNNAGIKECPPCPICGGEMKIEGNFFCTFNTCVKCKWGVSDMGMI